MRRVGLYLPYGANNRAEFNHTQLVPTKMASRSLRRTITASAPKDLQRMWLASGISSYVVDVNSTKLPSLASVAADGSGDRQASAPQQPRRRGAPRAVRALQSRKRGTPQRSRLARGQPRSARPGSGKPARSLDWMRLVLTSA